MSSALSFDCIEDLMLVQMSGVRPTNRVARELSVSAEIEGSRAEDNDRHLSIMTQIKVHANAIEDGEEPELLYKGAVQYFVRSRESVPPVDDDELIELLWPVMRAGLVEHAGRLGLPNLRLPLTVDSEAFSDSPVA